ncbi:MAG: winged helix-turn-helix domain-containing protein [Mycobacteriales bacterium]
MTHPTSALDEVVHQRVRLGILAVLAEARRADFTFLRNSLELSDGNLSRHLQVLEAAGYVSIAKEFEGRRPRTWVQATPAGRQAFYGELAALQALLDRISSQRRNP